MILEGSWTWVVRDHTLTDMEPGSVSAYQLDHGYQLVVNPEICDFCCRYIASTDAAMRDSVGGIAVCRDCLDQGLRDMARRMGLRDALRKRILERDGHRCQYCGKETEDLQVDHIVPLRRGGTDSPYNLITACAHCNRVKKDRSLGEFLAERFNRDRHEPVG